MTATYDPALIDKLVRAARDQYRLVEMQGYGLQAGTVHTMADQLEAARAEVERLRRFADEVGCALGVEGEPLADIEQAAWRAAGTAIAVSTLTAGPQQLADEARELRRTLATAEAERSALNTRQMFMACEIDGLQKKVAALESRIGTDMDMSRLHGKTARIEELQATVDALQEQIEAVAPVVDAAEAWRDTADDRGELLIDAIDAYRARSKP